MPTLSVIMVNKNHSYFLRESLKSISNQTYQDYEIILIDGNSTDGSQEIANSVPKLHLLVSTDRSGAEAYARGINLAKGKYMAFMTSTDYFIDAKWFEKAINELENNPAFSLVYGWHCIQNKGDLKNVGKVNFTRHRQAFFHWLTTTETFFELAFIAHSNVVRNCVSPLVDFEKSIEDLKEDLFFRLRYNFMKQGYVSKFLDLKVCFQRAHDNRVSDKARDFFTRHIHIYRDSVSEFRKNLSYKPIVKFALRDHVQKKISNLFFLPFFSVFPRYLFFKIKSKFLFQYKSIQRN